MSRPRSEHPYVLIGLGAILVAASELLLKKGAVSAVPLSPSLRWLGVGALASGWTWLGIITYILSFVCWLAVLRRLPLGIAFALINIVHVLVPLGAWAILGESISSGRWAGIALVFAGTVLVAGPAARAETTT